MEPPVPRLCEQSELTDGEKTDRENHENGLRTWEGPHRGAGSSSRKKTFCPRLGPPWRHREGACGHSPSKAACDRVGGEEGAQNVGEA